MRDTRLDITFDHEGPLLTYGPGKPYTDHDDHMADIIGTLRVTTGGGHNNWSVDPRPRGRNMSAPDPDGEKLRHYHIIFYLPPAAAEIFRLDEEAFWRVSGIPYYVEQLGLTNLKGVLQHD